MRILNENPNGKKLRAMLQSSELEFLMEAHSGMSAKIAAEAGFKGLWLSGLSLSAVNGVRDNCELTITQVADLAHFVTEAAPELPVLVDADNLYDNFNSARIAANLYEQVGVAGVVAEDKSGMKTNSLLDSGSKQPLADVDEFCGKLKAARSVVSPDFVIIARLESFITGYGCDHAFDRACKYAEAGVDAILVHSKKSTSEDIDAFMNRWNNSEYSNVPIVIVPTKYYSVPVDHFREIGISLVIWANHQMRASVTAMKKLCAQVYNDQSLINVESDIIPVSEVFRLQNDKELKEAEKQFLPTKGRDMNAIILAASRGSNMDEFTKDKPKCWLQYQGESIIERQIRLLNKAGIKDITVVTGYKPESFEKLKNVSLVHNDQYQNFETSSLNMVAGRIKKDTIIIFGDIVFKSFVLENLISNQSENPVIVVDSLIDDKRGLDWDAIIASKPDSKFTPHADDVELINIFETDSDGVAEPMGEFVGVWSVGNKFKEVRDVLHTLNYTHESTNELLSTLVANEITVNVQYIKGNWLNIDTIADLQRRM